MPEPGATGSGVGAGMAGGGSGIGAGEAEGPGVEGGHGMDTFEGYDLTSDVDLAGALADALAASNVDDFGAIAVEDIASRNAQKEAAIQERQALAQRMAEIDAAIAYSTSGTEGSAASNPYAGPAFQDDFSQIARQNEADIAAQDFAGWGQATDPLGSAAGLYAAAGSAGTPYDANEFASAQNAPNLATGPEMFGGWNQGVAQGYNFDQTQQGHPDFPGSAGVFGTGVEDFTGDAFTGTMGQGGVSQNIGMINAGTTQDSAGTVSPGGGMIGMGSVEMDEGTLDPNAGGVSAPAATTVTEQDTQQAVMPEELSKSPKVINQSVMDAANKLDKEAKEAREKFGIFSRQYQEKQRLANAFKTLDAYSKAYSATQGGSFIGSIISSALPFGSIMGHAIKGVQAWLEGQGLHNKQTGQELIGMLRDAQKKGNLNELMRELQGGGGPTQEEIQIGEFVKKYPWSQGLDPRYIQYLMANPAEVESLISGEKELFDVRMPA